MAEPQLVSALRRLTGAVRGGDLTDSQLLEHFAGTGEDSAFAALLERHGRLVWSVCRHVLRNEADIEDAFQATFLVLARKAGAITKGEALASWLYGVAHRVALKARARAARQALVRPAPPPSQPGPVAEAALREVQAILDDEVRLLPEKLRAPFVLCCLEGLSKAEAARELGWKEGTVSGRLAQARDRLRGRLARRGVGLTAALTATALGQDAALPAAARAAATEAVSGKVASSGAEALAEGVMRSLFARKLGGLLVLVLLASVGIGWVSQGMWAAPTAAQAPEKAPPVAPPPRVDALGDPLPPGALARLGTTRLRHGDLVATVAYAPDGKFVAAAGQDRTVRLWDPVTGKELARLQGHTGAVRCVALSPDGKTLASASADATVCLWELKDGRPTAAPRRLHGHKDSVMAVLFTPDGKSLITGGWDGSIRVWDVKSGRELRSFGLGKGKLRSLALAPDGKTLASANGVGPFGKEVAAVHLWDLPGERHLRQVVGGQKPIYRLAFSPKGTTLATGGDDGARVWKVADGTPVVKLRGSGSYTPCVLFSPDGRSLIAGGSGFLRQWSLTTGQVTRSFDSGAVYTYDAAFAPDGKTLATGSTRAVSLWDAATAKPRHRFEGHSAEVTGLVFTPDSKHLLTGGYGRAIYRWEAATGRRVGRLDGPMSDWNSTLVLSPDGKTLVAPGDNLAVVLLDADSGRQRLKFTKHLPPRISGRTPMNVLFAPDGKSVFSSTHGIDDRIRRWEADTGKEVLSIVVGKAGIVGLALSPDGKTLYSVSRTGPVRVWDAGTGKEMRQIGKPGEGAMRLALSPNGRRLACLLSTGVCVWDTATGQELGRFLRPRGYTPSLTFSADSRTLAIIGDEDDRGRFWELASGQLRLELRGHSGPVKALAFSPDGRLLATGSGDTTVLVWDYRSLPLVGEPAVAELSGKRLDDLVAALSGADAVAAFRAVCALARAPKKAVPALAGRLGVADAKRLAGLIAQLGDSEFAVRERATRELTALGLAAEAALRKTQARSPNVDVRLRAGVILRTIETSGRVRRLFALRALEVLEAAGTPEARRLLGQVAKGLPEAEQTQEAREALRRLARRKGV